MRCSRIRKLLQDYLEHELDRETEKKFLDHVNSCKKCGEALLFYKKYLREVRDIRAVEAPPDFLKNLKERIRKSSPLGDFLRKLFIPFPVKVPLELAGVTTVLLFIILVIQPALRRSPMENTDFMVRDEETPVSESSAERPAGKDLPAPKEVPAPASEKQKVHKAVTAQDKKAGDLKRPVYGTRTEPAALTGRDDGLINVAILPRESRQMEDAAVLTSGAKDTEGLSRGAVMREKSLKRSLDRTGTTASKTEEEKAAEEQDVFSLSAKKERKKEQAGKTDKLMNFSTNDLVRINAIVTNLKGRILTQEHRRAVPDQSFILIEMPMYNYRQFLEQLNIDYNVQKPAGEIPLQERKKARIQLQYQSIQK